MPQLIGPYRVLGGLGSGGFGAVYRARAEGGGADVALKLLHPELASSLDAVERFRREIRAVSRIRHPNVVAVLDFGADGSPYYVMELLSGVDLKRHLVEQGRLSPRETLAVLAPLGRALAAAHDQGIVHRDVKASNVFLDASGGERRVVLLDFGVAKLMDDRGPGLTSSRAIIGTAACMAPEQILGHRVDARTDVYGLGVLAYQLLTGALPFAHEHATVVRDMHLRAAPPPVSPRAPVSPEIDRLIGRAMSKDPADRQPSVGELVADFARALDGSRSGADDALAVHIDAPGEAPPEMVRALLAFGMELAFEAGNAVTLLLRLPGDRCAERDRRRRALALVGQLCAGAGAGVAVYLHRGPAAGLLRLGAWMPEEPTAGVVGTSAAFDGLDLVTEPVAASAGFSRWREECE